MKGGHLARDLVGELTVIRLKMIDNPTDQVLSSMVMTMIMSLITKHLMMMTMLMVRIMKMIVRDLMPVSYRKKMKKRI